MNRTLLPRGLGPVHFIGIGGIGMSGIAEILLGEGFAVQGSDAKGSAITERLARLGAVIHVGHEAAHVTGASVVVASTAIKPSNPEYAEAKRLGLPVVRRAEMLAELMRLRRTVSIAGTHGKTTTTTMMAAMLEAGGFDPGVVNGGIIHAYGSNAKAGAGEWMVVEADESDGSFNIMPTHVAVVTNIDPEHMDHWKDFDTLRDGFRRFVQGIPFYGLAVLCTDHPEVAALAGRIENRQIVTFGFNEGADLRALNLRFEKGVAHFDIGLQREGRVIAGVTLPMPGDHNVSNALSSVAVGLHLGMSDDRIRAALAGFAGVGRRFTRVGEVNGVTVIDDYGHHPVEIAAVIKAARQSLGGSGRVIAVHQPHRFTRLSSLFADFAACFDGADVVAIAEVYSAGEEPIPGVDRDHLVAAIRGRGHPSAHALTQEADLEALVRAEAKPGDMVVCLGAGTISAWAQALPGHLSTAG
ncbi:UDP-N-acetylmuramate--L-alanine ligase [Pararhodobacter aggregans]|uniref:UDP-N-acetylmuramate--L-alanine ligase n=1 Tax=Pararhodobacter aggregans TaxID=404875 RepID=A0A2T7UVV4_9RHOB|nr:UDP-N-acetylmuramate--L-alanine ligase [Pararhodobacter aggregans]PTX04023.1 UDP-N-acetylmuramate--L-alanine ligase [Pararhodobacter aggregans]PVE48812.1 UDP-N-acetylmuramate--L-alanine ligase [Pararhodobacter aggregans]